MKKILAMILAAMLVLCIGTVVLADENETAPNYTDAQTVVVEKVYKLEGAGTSPAETFTLQQVGDGVVADGEATDAPALGTITGAVFAAGEATAEGTKKEITIALPQYTAVGVYEYTLKEVVGTTAGVTYYTNDIKLVVTVINDNNGKLRVAAVHTEATGEAKSKQFDNTYSAGALEISKNVTGILGDKSKYFKFTVTLTGVEGQTYAEGGFAVSGGSNANNPGTIAINTSTIFYLKDSETLSIANLPYGVTYNVVEDDYTTEGYDEAAYNFSDNEKKINSEKDTVGVTNNKGGTPDTGIFLDNMPYIVILGVVALAGVALIAKRRNAEN